MPNNIKVSAFKTNKKNELYLFVPQKKDPAASLTNLPNELLVMFGKPKHIFDFTLSKNKALPRSNSKEVIASLKNKGYYLQMPPGEIEKISDMPAPPERLDNIF